MVEKNIRAHALRIVRRVPDIRHKFVGISDADNRMLAAILLDAENDDAAIGVCERAVRFPERSRHTALRQLELDGIRLALGQQTLYGILRQHTSLGCCPAFEHTMSTVFFISFTSNAPSHVINHAKS